MRTRNNEFASLNCAFQHILEVVETWVHVQIVIVYFVEGVEGRQEDGSDLNSRGKFFINTVHLKALFIELEVLFSGVFVVTSGKYDWNTFGYPTKHHDEFLIVFTVISYQVISNIPIYQKTMNFVLSSDSCEELVETCVPCCFEIGPVRQNDQINLFAVLHSVSITSVTSAILTRMKSFEKGIGLALPPSHPKALQ